MRPSHTHPDSSTGIKDLDILRTRVAHLQNEAETKLHVYRCVARAAFLKPKVNLFPTYKEIPRSGRILEIGCCFGTEVRKYLTDGFSPDNIIATDVTDGYWKLGQDLYGDDLNVRTIFADTACEESQVSAEVSSLYGSVDALVALAVFHVLSKDQVENMVDRIARLLKPGGRFIGYCAGSQTAGPWDGTQMLANNQDREKSDRYLHSVESMTALLQEAGFDHLSIREDDGVLFPSQSDGAIRSSCGNSNCRILIEASRVA